ncbi:hypothetical protein [Desulfovibrio sp. SGI.133]|uniref:hypothetical protein n=1 Tax=Desulfovibrio sp. SGI.133 TaxID=3420560 RepID=UPI003CFBE849
MSKTAKGLLAALIICVLAVVGGLFACKPLVEQAVRDTLRTANPDAAICSVETVDINPLSFTLKLGNIHISDQRTYDTVLKEISLTLSPRFILACVPFLRDSILPATGDAPLFSSATGRDLIEKSLIPGDSVTCTVEGLTSGPVAMDAAVLKRLLNGQQVPEGELMIAVIAEKVTYGPVRISSTSADAQMQSSIAAVSIEGVDRRTWKRMTMDATEVTIRSEGAFKMGKLEIRDIFLPDADWFGRFLSLVRRTDETGIDEFELQLEALLMEIARPQKDAAGKQMMTRPFFGQLTVKEVDIIESPGRKNENLFHAGEMRFDWLGLSPHHFKSSLACDFSTKPLREMIAIPGKERIALKWQDDTLEKSENLLRQTGRLSLEGLADLDYAYNFFSEDPSMMDAAVSDLSLDLHDHGLTAVLAYNIDPRPEAMEAMMPLLGASLSRDLGDPADAEAIQTFLARPGSLSIRSEDPAQLMPWIQFLDPAALGRMLALTATPGEKSLPEQMKALMAH